LNLNISTRNEFKSPILPGETLYFKTKGNNRSLQSNHMRPYNDKVFADFSTIRPYINCNPTSLKQIKLRTSENIETSAWARKEQNVAR